MRQDHKCHAALIYHRQQPKYRASTNPLKPYSIMRITPRLPTTKPSLHRPTIHRPLHLKRTTRHSLLLIHKRTTRRTRPVRIILAIKLMRADSLAIIGPQIMELQTPALILLGSLSALDEAEEDETAAARGVADICQVLGDLGVDCCAAERFVCEAEGWARDVEVDAGSVVISIGDACVRWNGQDTYVASSLCGRW